MEQFRAFDAIVRNSFTVLHDIDFLSYISYSVLGTEYLLPFKVIQLAKAVDK